SEPHVVLLPLTAPSTPYTLSLHDALPISSARLRRFGQSDGGVSTHSSTASTTPTMSSSNDSVNPWANSESGAGSSRRSASAIRRSEEHTSELQSRGHLVCRLLLETKNRC